MSIKNELPELPFEKWNDTRITLHLIFQIIGKAKLKITHRKNHWWYITLFPSLKGFSTHPISTNDGLELMEIELDISRKAVILSKSSGEEIAISLQQGFTIANFYTRFMSALDTFGYHPEFIKKPLDMGIDKKFEEITEYHHYDWEYIRQFWQAMLWNSDVFQEFSGRFYGKTCPVHIYWHSLDLTVTRFSGKRLPQNSEKPGRLLERDTYSHEQISFGFWAGDKKTPEPMYYCYTHPSPPSVDKENLSPAQAMWIQANGSPMAVLRYADVRSSEDPRSTLLDFMESAYQAGAKRAGWDIKKLTVPPLSEI